MIFKSWKNSVENYKKNFKIKYNRKHFCLRSVNSNAVLDSAVSVTPELNSAVLMVLQSLNQGCQGHHKVFCTCEYLRRSQKILSKITQVYCLSTRPISTFLDWPKFFRVGSYRKILPSKSYMLLWLLLWKQSDKNPNHVWTINNGSMGMSVGSFEDAVAH